MKRIFSKNLATVLLCLIIVAIASEGFVVLAAKFSQGDIVEVINTLGVGLRIRDSPAGNVIGVKYDGTRGMILAGPQSASLGGVVYTWWKVRWADDALEGWSAEGYPGGVDYLLKIYISPSTKFNIGDTVKVSTGGYNLIVRTDPPALAYKGIVPDGATGNIEGGPFYGVAEGTAGFYHFWKINYGSIIGWSAENWLTKFTVVGEPVITSSLIIIQSPPYYVGDTITATFTITNKATLPFTFDVLTVGGRDPDGQVADFTWVTSLTLNPGASYNYQGTLKLTKAGNYHFFCAYRKTDGSWNTAIPTESGVTNVLDITVSYPTELRTWTVDDDLQENPNADFTKIQDAINAATVGDTVIVYPGTYYEVINIKKSIILKGLNHPIIDGEGRSIGIYVQADKCTIQGFKVVNFVSVGIYLPYSMDNTVSDNYIHGITYTGIYLNRANKNIIRRNHIQGCREGIFIEEGDENHILYNNIIENFWGIMLSKGEESSDNNVIYLNDFIDNNVNAHTDVGSNLWNSPEKIAYTYNGKTYSNYLGNYWDDYTGGDADGDGVGDIPYSIDGYSDNYPLMKGCTKLPMLGPTIGPAWALVTPSIDGIISLGEWDDADSIFFMLTSQVGETHLGTLWVKNDAQYLYLAVKVLGDDFHPGDGSFFYFDNDNDGSGEVGDDWLYVVAGLDGRGYAEDGFRSIIPEGICWTSDTADGGTKDILGAAHHTNIGGVGDYSFELMHPLDSADDAHDFSLELHDMVGVRLEFDDAFPGGAHSSPWPSFGTFATILLAPTLGGPDNFADLGNLADEAFHNLVGWGSAQGPPENPHVSPSGDSTKRYQLLRGDNFLDLMVDEVGVPYLLTAEVEDGYCTDNFEIYVNGMGPIYSYTGKNAGVGPVTVVRHEVLVPAEYITAQRVTITFRNTATDNCGLAAVYNVALTKISENRPPTCVVRLQKDGVEISEVDVGEFFDIYVGDSLDDTGIKQVRFSSDDVQDGVPTGEWTKWYDWDVSSEDWDAETKIKRWAFATYGPKEIWVEVKDTGENIDKSSVNIFAGWSFIMITDLHIGRGYSDYGGEGTNDIGSSGQDYYLTKRLEEVVNWINQNYRSSNIKFLVVLGDISDSGEYSEMKKAKDILDKLEIPYFPVIGNHDVWSKVEGTEEEPVGDRYFESIFNKTFLDSQIEGLGEGLEWKYTYDFIWSHYYNYAFDYRGKTFMFLDSVNRKESPMRPRVHAVLDIDTMRLLEDWLEHASSEGKPVIIFTHHPMVDPKKEYLPIWEYISMEVSCFSDEDLRILENLFYSTNADVKANFAGHVHGFYDPEKLFIPIWNPVFLDANVNYKEKECYTPAEIDVVTAEALMVGSNEQTPKTSKGIIRIAKVEGERIDFNTVHGEFYALNPYFKASKGIEKEYLLTSPILIINELVRNGLMRVDFEVYAFTKRYSTERPLAYSLNYGDGVAEIKYSDKVELVNFTHYYDIKVKKNYNVTLTVLGYTPEGEKIIEKISRNITLPSPLVVIAQSPIDLTVEDPDGLIISKQLNEVPDSAYMEFDFNQDGHLDDIIFIPDRKIGIYSITVEPEPQANPTDTYTLVVWAENIMRTLVENVEVENAPTQPYIIISTETEITADNTPPETSILIGDPKFVVGDITYLTPTTSISLVAEDNVGGSGVALTAYRIYNASYDYDSGWINYVQPFNLSGLSDGAYNIDFNSTDNAGNVEETNTATVILDNAGPSMNIINPQKGWALQDGVTFIVQATDLSGTWSLNFSIREANGDQGIPVGFEDISATYNASTKMWELFFDTLQLQDGFYIVIVEAEDNLGNTASITVPYSIRNWAVLELLPATSNNKAGRTMPIKFTLRVAASVDPNQPFIYNEELTIKIYATDNPSNILQISTFGDSARDYRIDTIAEHYITNFKTLKTPKTYTVEIWRKNMLIGSFNFKTVK